MSSFLLSIVTLIIIIHFTILSLLIKSEYYGMLVLIKKNIKNHTSENSKVILAFNKKDNIFVPIDIYYI